MPKVIKPFGIADVPTKPDLNPQPALSDDIQQVLSTIMAWDGSTRRLIMTALGGALHVTTPQLKTIVTKTGSGASDVITFSSEPTTEVMVMGHPDNGDLLWVTQGKTPTTANSWPLLKYEVFSFSIDDLQKLQILIVAAGEKAIIAYTR